MRWPPRDPYENLKESWARESQIQRSRYPPYHPAYSALEAEADDDDDVPLAELRQRNVRIRRGSEGFEIRPHGLDTSDDDEASEQDEAPDENWDQLYDKRGTALYDSASDDD
jgi:palmitoyltransferase